MRKTVEGMVKKLESDLEHVDSTIGDKLHMLDQDGDGKLTVQELLDIIEKRQALYNDSLSEDEVESVESQLKDQEEKRELEEEVINEETAIDKVKDERGKP